MLASHRYSEGRKLQKVGKPTKDDSFTPPGPILSDPSLNPAEDSCPIKGGVIGMGLGYYPPPPPRHFTYA
ncbi:hypothetical protein Nepgr_000670 [Nepenthes gracilis]|uniref:Uncharacterized protein n=1 Tax=Nepenthes gracilis TaxID=150966 RepID=A0AAD3P3J4_NEPGR|nr:hypothetical protein Nepgr_000670 [Nepenthes gracilis]